MFQPNRRDRRLSEDLRCLVHKGLSERQQDFAWPGVNRISGKDSFQSNLKMSGKEMDQLPLQDELGGETCSAVSDDRKNIAFAASILEGQQNYSNVLLESNLCDK